MPTLKQVTLADLPVSNTREGKVSSGIFRDIESSGADLIQVDLGEGEKLASMRSTLSNYVQRHGHNYRVFTRGGNLYVERCENGVGVETGEPAVRPKTATETA